MQPAFQTIRQRALARELMIGTFINLGSSITTEIAGRSGLDWLLIDLEHGAGDQEALVGQIQAAGATPAAPVVRIAANDSWRFKRVLDLGASGIMVPWVNTEEEAKAVVSAMRYPPQGVRGVAKLNRASGFGRQFDDYFAEANDSLLTVAQIEQHRALSSLDAIAAVDGIDVLFLGPLDMSVSMGIPQQYDHPDFIAVKKQIAETAIRAGKAAGTLLLSPDLIGPTIEMGYSFIALGSDGGAVASGMNDIVNAFKPFR